MPASCVTPAYMYGLETETRGQCTRLQKQLDMKNRGSEESGLEINGRT